MEGGNAQGSGRDARWVRWEEVLALSMAVSIAARLGMTQPPQLGGWTVSDARDEKFEIWTFEGTEQGAENMLRSGKALSV
jgi:hypothetical protein